MVDEPLRQRIGRVLRQERNRLGLSASELARRAGVSKASVSQLESGTGNPSVELLWALADGLGVPFATLVETENFAPTMIRAGSATPVLASGSHYSAALLSACPPGARRDIYLVTAEPGEAKRSAPHQAGTVEHVVLVAGSADVGPTDSPLVLRAGDYLSYRGDAEHVFCANEPGTMAVVVSEIR
jgi:transcriptional regulator with XRE-family HTH domain